MKEYSVTKEIDRKPSISLLLFLGKSLTEEYSSSVKTAKSSDVKRLYFKFKDGYERFEEGNIEDFIKDCKIKKGTNINFSFFHGQKNFHVDIEYDTAFNRLQNVHPPLARFSVSARSEDQIWCEGITSKFLKLINEFEESRIDEKPIEVKISNTDDLKTEVKSSVKNKIKNHLSQIITSVIGSIIVGIIFLWYSSKP